LTSKKIVLFADGTGNAFSTQESNVWRLYEALDQSQPDQIAHYIKGVGTSAIRPFAIVDGATGVGLPANVRKLYRFLCWNWEAGDEIYMFGFSRGSFTVRTLIGLLGAEGLVPRHIDGEPVSRTEMGRNALAAWRSYRGKTVPWHKCLPTIWLARAIRDLVIAIRNELLRYRSYGAVHGETLAQKRVGVPITFLGLFDTVDAYGVPIEELRNAIDWAIWPMSFRNQVLSGNVRYARHALSLDDERTTFHPLLFDMRAETTDRIREVWFAGVHSDVGGGYPDSALAHVPLVWMAQEATQLQAGAGIRLVPDAMDRFQAAASALAPNHDSRQGLAVFYRYDPRTVERLGNGKADSAPLIHYSAAEKMVFGSESYAPVTLPSTANVLMPDGTSCEIQKYQPPAGAGPTTRVAAAVGALTPDSHFASLTMDTVWWRRIAYFGLLAAAALVASLPLTASKLAGMAYSALGAFLALFLSSSASQAVLDWITGVNSGVGTALKSAGKAVGDLLPSYAGKWVEVLIAYPIVSALVLLIAVAVYRCNASLRDLIADRARRAWYFAGRKVRAGSETGGVATRLAHRLRSSAVMRAIYKVVANVVLPGIALLAIASLVLVAVSRTTVNYQAGEGGLCVGTDKEKAVELLSFDAVPALTEFHADDPCWASGIMVEKRQRYTLWIEMDRRFFDREIPSDVAGFHDTLLRHLVALPFRRWSSADWFQPIARIGASGDAEWPLIAIDGKEPVELTVDAHGNTIPPFFYEDDSYGARLAELRRGEAKLDPSRIGRCDKLPENEVRAAEAVWDKRDLRRRFVSQFVASESGELFLYVNDVLQALPFMGKISCYYDNNRGSAKVFVQKVAPPTH
jgi:hypothetical protein